MRNLKRGFANIRKQIRRGNEEASIDLLNELQLLVEEKINTYLIMLETKNKQCCDVGERYLEVTYNETSTSKLTVNPVEGRFTLKISNKVSDVVEEELITGVKEHLMKLEDLPPTTLRGKIAWHNSKGCYSWYGQSNSKKINYWGYF